MSAPRPSPRAAAAAALLLAAAVLAAATVADAAGRRSLRYHLPQDTLESFRFEVAQRVTTELTRLPPEADAYDVASLTERLDDVSTAVSGRLERYVGRVFRDSSLGLISRLVDVEGTIARGADAPAPVDLGVLEGKSVSLRVLGSGEILDSFGWAWFSGAARGADLVVEPLLLQVFRLPAHAPKSDPLGSTFRVRWNVDPSLERVVDHVVAFSPADAPDSCRRCVAMTYTADLREASRDQHPARPMALDGTGTLSGTLVVGAPVAGGRPLVSHTWEATWDRTVRSEREGGALRGEIELHVELSGGLWRDDR